MNKLYVATITALLFSVPLLVQADSHEAGELQGKWDHYTEQWQERMNTMHEQMDRIDQTNDPAKRQRLLEEHWKTMDEQMRDMRMMEGMMGGMMGGMHGRRGDQGRGHMNMMDPEQRGRYMQDRMDMPLQLILIRK